MSCGCSSVHTPPTLTSCNATYNVCTGKSFYINVTGCENPIVTIPTQSQVGYPLVGSLEYSEVNKKIYYTHNGANTDVTAVDSFTYSVECNGIVKTCTITINIDDSISVDTTVVELDGCCIPTYTAKVYGITVNSIIVDNFNILSTADMSYVTADALSVFLNTYIGVNGTFTVDKTVVSGVTTWTVSFASNTKIMSSVTGTTLVQAVKTLCGCAVGDVEYTWCIPDCATLAPGYSIHDCKIQVVVPLYDANDDACCPIDLTVRCGNCQSNCEKTETYNWCPPIYENCQTPDCTIYPCTTYNPISGNCDSICDECDTCCQNESGYYCAECCDNNGCALANCTEENQPLCVNGECLCYINGVPVPPLPNGCCPNCTENTVIPNCHTCINGIIVPPDTNCLSNQVYNYQTCQCECDCTNGFCYNVLTQSCVPCPVCSTISGMYTCNGEPYTITTPPCTQCINGNIVPNTCAEGSQPNPYFNPNLPVSNTNPCCISLVPCDCDNPTCVGQGAVCTQINGSENCYCVNCSSLSCTNTSILCEEVNGCDCVTNNCTSGCPTCTGNITITEYCNPFFIKFVDCSNGNYRFKVYELTNLLVKPALGCSYTAYLNEYNNNFSNLTDITTSIVGNTQYNVTSSIFFNPATVDSNGYIVIPKENVQTVLLKTTKYGIESIYEFVLNEGTCTLANENNDGTDLIVPQNPRIFRETCKFIYGISSNCLFNDYEWEFVNNPTDGDSAIEIQNGKYIIIFPPDFTLGTTRQLCVTGKYIYDDVVCYFKEACKDYSPCTGGCGCDPCNDPNSGFISSIETIENTTNNTISASASVLLNCNGTIGGLLATCEPASTNEVCENDNVDHNGTSPLPFSDYEDINHFCGIWNCSQTITGCEVATQAPCGWVYDDTKLEVIDYNGANIEVGFVGDSISGKLCWGARYECGYVCTCKDIVKTLGCEDYDITSVTINCPPTNQSTNSGTLLVNVNNNNQPYNISIYKQGTPDILLSTVAGNISGYNSITISNSWNIVNGDTLIVKVYMVIDEIDCDYEESVVYNCCITPTVSDLSALCNEDTGVVTSVTFTTNTAGNPYTIYNGATVITTGTTVPGINTITTSISNATTIKVKVCDDNTNDCCAEMSFPITCSKNCTITGVDIVVLCGDPITVTIEGTINIVPNTVNIRVEVDTPSNYILLINKTLPYTLLPDEITDLGIVEGSVITAIITSTEDDECTATATETVNCDVPCSIDVILNTHCHAGNLSFDNITVTGGSGLYSGTAVFTITTVGNPPNGSPTYSKTYTNVPSPLSTPFANLLIGTNECLNYTITINDAADINCRKTIIGCIPSCNSTTNTFDCINNHCVQHISNNGSEGQYANQKLCLEDCEMNIPLNCGEVFTRAEDIGVISTAIIDVSAANDESIMYLDAAFGGKPEKYIIYQINDNGDKTKILESPYLGCDCESINKSLAGYWSNVNDLSATGTYDINTVASCANPFTFDITSDNYSGSGNYSGLNYGLWTNRNIWAANRGRVYTFIPNNSTWINDYDNGCNHISSRDYETCGTCSIVTNNYEEINAKALSRIYFKYIESYGTLIQIEVEHGIHGQSCKNGTHGVKFKLVCEDNPTKYNCVNNACIEDINGNYDTMQLCIDSGCVDNITCAPIDGGITDPPIDPEPGNNNTIYTPLCDNINSELFPIYNTPLNDIIPSLNYTLSDDITFSDNILSIGYGYKETNGVLTDKIGYVVTVKEKLPLAEVPVNERIPKHINGIITDVIKVPIFDTMYNNHLSTYNNKTAYLNGGSISTTTATTCLGNQQCADAWNSSCPCNAGEPRGTAIISHSLASNLNNTVYGGQSMYVFEGSTPKSRGTICLVAKETATGKLVGLTNNHVLGAYTSTSSAKITIPDNLKRNYRQALTLIPSISPCLNTAGNYSGSYGESYKTIPFPTTSLAFQIAVDAGLFSINTDWAATDIHEIGTGGHEWLTLAELGGNPSSLIGKPVYKTGATTGTKALIGKITYVNNISQASYVNESNNTISYQLTNQIIIEPITSTLYLCESVMSLPGDSGSPILVEINGTLKVVGILWGGNATFNAIRTVASPIWNVASLLGIEYWDGSIVVDSQSDYIQLNRNGRYYEKGAATNQQITHNAFTEINTLPTCS